MPPLIRVGSAAFSSAGGVLVVGYDGVTGDPTVEPQMSAWDIKTGKKLWETVGRENRQVVGFLPSDREFLVHAGWGSGGNCLQVRRTETGAVARRLADHGRSIVAAGLSADGGTVVTADREGLVKVWRSADGKELQSFLTPGGTTFPDRVCLSADGSRALLVVAPHSTTGVAGLLYDLRAGKLLREWYCDAGWTAPAALSPDGKTVVIGRLVERAEGGKETYATCIWDVGLSRVVGELPGNTPVVAVVPGGLVCLGYEGGLSLRDGKTGEDRWRVPPSRRGGWFAAVSADGTLVVRAEGTYQRWVVGSMGGKRGDGVRLEVFEVKDGKRVQEFDVPLW
jgi:WD40 repeat protein